MQQPEVCICWQALQRMGGSVPPGGAGGRRGALDAGGRAAGPAAPACEPQAPVRPRSSARGGLGSEQAWSQGQSVGFARFTANPST